MTKLEKKVAGLTAPTRRGNAFTAKWEVSAACKKDNASNKVRFDGLDWYWDFDAGKQQKKLKKAKGDVVRHDSTGKNTATTDNETLPRKKFYPETSAKLVNAEIWVRGYNVQSGKKHYGPFVHKSLTLEKPAKPTVKVEYDEPSGTFTASYTAKNVDGARERYDTHLKLVVNGETKYSQATTAETKTTPAYELPSAHSLGVGQWRKAVATAYNRGLRGDSDKASHAVYVFHPNPPTCGAPSLQYVTRGVLSTAYVRVPVTDSGGVKDGKTYIGSAEVTLQRLKNSATATDATSASAASGWTDVQTDAGKCEGLTDTWTDGVSDEGLYTWYRIAAVNDGYTTYGPPVQAKCLNRVGSSTSTGRARITAATPNADGRSVTLTITGKEADDDGYEVSWSDAADAWESTDQPSVFATAGSTLTVKGLDEGTQYWFKARAYDLDSDGNMVYGQYSDPAIATPYTTPSAVVLSGAGVTPRGSNLVLSWTYDTESPQTEWRLVDTSGKARFSGKGTETSRVITPSEYGDAASLTLRVEMTTGGGWAASEYMAFAIAEPPTCTLAIAETITAQPMALTVASDTGDTVSVSVTALGSSGTGLYGDPQQYAGDTVWSGELTPEWTGSGNARTASIALPTMELHQDARYLVEVSVLDASTGLRSAAASSTVAVAWAHRAQQPTVTVTPDAAAVSATVQVDAPADYALGDRFDLYRVGIDGERRIADTQPFGTSITDRLAPFTLDGSGLRYIAVTRTADGDACVSDDAPYALANRSLRLDWGTDSIELPYDLQIEDGYQKDGEVRKHADGTTQAYWNSGITRTGSFETNLIRFEDAEQRELLSAMLQHPGSVFVRTPDGNAYAADVQPGTVSRSAAGGLVGVSLSATEHDLTDEGRPQATDIVQPVWGGGAVEAHNGIVYDAAGQFPMDDWTFIGYASSTLYVADADNAVRDGSGAAPSGWTWDGAVLYDGNGDAVEVTEEA